MFQRVLNMLIGTWLIFSAFAWRHTSAQFANTVVSGALLLGFAVYSVYSRRGTQLSILLALWLFLSALFRLSINELTAWNNALCAIAAFVSSLSIEGTERRRQRAYGGARLT